LLYGPRFLSGRSDGSDGPNPEGLYPRR